MGFIVEEDLNFTHFVLGLDDEVIYFQAKIKRFWHNLINLLEILFVNSLKGEIPNIIKINPHKLFTIKSHDSNLIILNPFFTKTSIFIF